MRRKSSFPVLLILVCAVVAVSLVTRPAQAQPRSGREAASGAAHDGIPAVDRVEPAKLAAMIRSGHAPVILQVGFTMLYTEAHIQGAIHAGPMVSAKGRALLEKTTANMDRHAPLVIYCGCCPWEKCPNIRAAYRALHQMGFTNVKTLYLADNFGADWVQHGYPTAKGN